MTGIISRESALARGLKRFRTGIPCAKGHESDRFTRDGRCVACVYGNNAGWVARNPEKARAVHKQWLADNAEHRKARLRENHREWLAKNREKKQAQQRAWLARKKEQARQ